MRSIGVLALAICLASPAAAFDFNQVVLGADLLVFDGGEFSGPIEQNFLSEEISGLDRAFGAPGLLIGSRRQARIGTFHSGGLLIEVDDRWDTEMRWDRGHTDVAFRSRDDDIREVGQAHWMIFQARPFGPDEDAGSQMHWRLIPSGPDVLGRLIVTWERILPAAGDPRWNSAQLVMTALEPGEGEPGDAHVEVRYARCEWTQHGRNSFAVVGWHNTVQRNDRVIVTQPDWSHPANFTPHIKKMCLLSNVNERGVWRYVLRGGRIETPPEHPCGPGHDPYVWSPDDEPGSPCEDDDNDPGDGCSSDCRVERNDDGDILFEPPPDPWLNADGTVYDPLQVYDSCVAAPEDVERLCGDLDFDGIPADRDNCPETPNIAQLDFDLDGEGDACDLDIDNDGLPNNIDFCPYGFSVLFTDPFGFPPQAHYFQPDTDRDFDDPGALHRGGDRCDPDDDNDGVLDCGNDGICPHFDDGTGNSEPVLRAADPVQGEGWLRNDEVDNDRDGFIDEAGEGTRFVDGDHDLIDSPDDPDNIVDNAEEAELPAIYWPGRDPDGSEDNCRQVPNPDQANLDGDIWGDACDDDLDGDFISNCGLDGLCNPAWDARDNDDDGMVDEEGECIDGCPTLTDGYDNDNDGRIDEWIHPAGAGELAAQSSEDGLPVIPWPGPDEGEDNCPFHRNMDQADADGDGLGDACDDDDGDGYFLAAQDMPLPTLIDQHEPGLPADNCPDVPNPDQLNSDGMDDGGDACDNDDDDDGIPDESDNCPTVPNPGQQDLGGSPLGNACDPDIDGDGHLNDDDFCPFVASTDNVDTDGDGDGDLCDANDDNDRFEDGEDNCPLIPNDDQANADEADDGGDACDDDDDNDGVPDGADNCPLDANPNQADGDGDQIGDLCEYRDDPDSDADSDEVKNRNDNCPFVPNLDQTNTDGAADGGDACDDDDDNDGVNDDEDACPLDPQAYLDTDGDGSGDDCGDFDDDEDGKDDPIDNCSLIPNPEQSDVDGDGEGDVCDGDADGDKIANENDNCPLVLNTEQADVDQDGRGDVCDDDADNDGIPNTADNCRLVYNPDQLDRDNNRIGDACATDPTEEEVKQCQAITQPARWHTCGGPTQRIGCGVQPGSPERSAWWLLVGGLLIGRRRRRRC
jgi:MYXO-CTERM domain-containing protein